MFYSLKTKLSTKSCFMEQKCQILMGIVKNAAIAIEQSICQYHTSALSNKVYSFVSAQGAQKL